jgi:hypothetical protein
MERDKNKLYTNNKCSTNQDCRYDYPVIKSLYDLITQQEQAYSDGVRAKKAELIIKKGVDNIQKQSLNYRCPTGAVNTQVRDVIGEDYKI